MSKSAIYKSISCILLLVFMYFAAACSISEDKKKSEKKECIYTSENRQANSINSAKTLKVNISNISVNKNN